MKQRRSIVIIALVVVVVLGVAWYLSIGGLSDNGSASSHVPEGIRSNSDDDSSGLADDYVGAASGETGRARIETQSDEEPVVDVNKPASKKEGKKRRRGRKKKDDSSDDDEPEEEKPDLRLQGKITIK